MVVRRMRGVVYPAIVSLSVFAAGVSGPSAAAALPQDAPAPARLRLKIAEFDPLAALPDLPAHLRFPSEPASGLFILQLRRPVDAAILASVRASGARLLEYVPDNAYLLSVPAGALPALRASADTRWMGALQPGWKISRELGTRPYSDPTRREGGWLHVTADVAAGEDAQTAAAAAAALGAEVLQVVRFESYARLKLRATRAQIEKVASLGAITWIEEAAEITLRNNTTRWVIQTDVPAATSVWDHGIHGEGQIIGHIDGRIDMNTCYIRDPVNNTPGPGHRKVIAYRSVFGLGADSHGTHTAGTSAGDQFPINGSLSQNGNAYAAKISHSSLNDINGSGTSPSNLYAYLSAAHTDGARVHTNSWGDDGTTAYTTWSLDIDRFSYDQEDSLVLFAVSNGSIATTPENAKNCVGVGASRNGTEDDIFCSGGRGPTNDGRRKPEIFAPGCSIVSARSNNACSTVGMTGTSMASPAMTAAGALVRQYYEEGWYPSGTKRVEDAVSPSGALVKATLLNSSVDMTGLTGYPSNQEGWGRVLLENALFFQGDTRQLSLMADVRNVSGLATGQVSSYELTVNASAEPLRVTLVWTDPPASLLANPASVNDLDLEVVSPSGVTYLGNVVDPATGLSIPGGAPDPRNNVEQVILGAPEAGDWTVRVRGKAVNLALQGYAVIASGQVKPFAPGILRHAGHAVQDAAPRGNGDGVLDPGETATMPVTLSNNGDTTATGIAAALSSDRPDLVKITLENASFPDIPADGTGTSLAPHYAYTLAPNVPCGTRIAFGLGMLSSVGEGTSGFSVEVGQTHADFAAPGLPLTVPKKSASGVSSSIPVADVFTIRDVNVAVDIAHGNIGELLVTLTSPGGQTVTLHNHTLAGTADLVAVYDRDRQPDGPGTMGQLDGGQAQGTWTLRVIDDTAGGTPAGSLRSWTLQFDSVTPIRCTPLGCGSPVPAEVAPQLFLTRENGTDLRFTWPALAGAAGYRIWRSESPDFGEEHFLAATSGTTFLQTGGAIAPVSFYYKVRAVNSCEWEGP